MSARKYLPSAQFMVIAASVAVAGGVVWAAQYYTSSREAPGVLASAADAATAQNPAWQQSLQDIQAKSGTSLPDAPNQSAVQNLLMQAKSSNLTDSIGRSVLVKLTTAGVQGLGDDIPTQDSIIAEASAQLNASRSSAKAPDLSIVETSDVAMRAYGNGVMQVLARHPKANSGDTMLAIARATDARDASQLAPLAGIAKEYRIVAEELARVPVPGTLSPLHLQIIKDFTIMADAYVDMGAVLDDPLRGVTALQKYRLTLGEAGRVFTNIAEAIKKSGILFSKDEPGMAWGTFLPAS